MVSRQETRSVYRYFDLADSFVQVLITDADTLRVAERPGLNRASYRRLVIQSCMPEFQGDLDQSLATLFPDDPLMVEDLLYQLCVEINPALDIHEVRLQTANGTLDELKTEKLQLECGDQYEQLLAGLSKRVHGLEQRLKKRVIGQEEAITLLTDAVKKAAVGLAAKDRPLASFLFTGRTGTGKTELARSLAHELYPESTPKNLVRVDCSEFALAHEYSKLIGSPPGYVGHEDGGQLTDAVSANPECIVLFDEVEKAHPRMHNLLLQILEEGALTDGKGRTVDFDRAIVILTSNAGAEEMMTAAGSVGFLRQPELGRGTLKTITKEALERLFSPEFLGRIDELVLFNELGKREVEKIAQKKLFELARRARDRGHEIAFTPAVARWVAKLGFSLEFGARELRRIIQREIEPLISETILAGDLQPGGLLRVRVQNGTISLSVED